MESQVIVHWIDHGREPHCAPNPEYPLGIDVDVSNGADKVCKAALPYPARRCGVYVVACERCGFRIAITTAGRADDPRSVLLPCATKGGGDD